MRGAAADTDGHFSDWVGRLLADAKSFVVMCRDCGSAGYVGAAAPPYDCLVCKSQNIRSHPELFDLTIAHIDCDAFYASVEKRDNPELTDKPVIVGGGDRGVVAAACYIARQYGVRSAMSTWQALKRCPHAVVIKPRMAHYIKISQQIRDHMLSLTPLVQPLSIDEAFLDLSGTQKLHKCSPAEALMQLQKQIYDDIGITVSIGLGANKSLAKMASERDKPNGFFVVGAAEAADWLAPQPVSVLFGIGKATLKKLHAAGYHSCADLAVAEQTRLEKVLGSQTRRIMALAQGIDPRPVTPERAAKSVSNETTFSRDLKSYKDLETVLERLCNKLAKRLKAAQLTATTVTLKLKRADHRIVTRSHSLDTATDKAHLLFAIGQKLLLPETKKGLPYRLLGIGVDNLNNKNMVSLFDHDGGLDDKRNRLEAAMHSLQSKLGDRIIQSGRQFSRNIARDDTDDID